MKALFGKVTLPGLLTIILLILCTGLAWAGVIHPAAGALPFIGIGAVKIRDSLERITTVKYTHTSATVKDTMYLLNTRVMLAMNSADANALNIYMIGGLVEYASDTGTAWAAGDKLYWDDTNKVFTKTSTSNTLCAMAYEAKASAAATATILLSQTP